MRHWPEHPIRASVRLRGTSTARSPRWISGLSGVWIVDEARVRIRRDGARGQLAPLRRLSGSPIPPENFFEAAIDPERLGLEQLDTRSPDAEWPEAPGISG